MQFAIQPTAWRRIAARVLMAAAVLVALPALAQGAGAVRKTMESSTLVLGEVGITPEGKVHDYRIEQPEKLPPEVLKLVDGVLPQWAFEPVLRGGQAIAARSKMSLRVVARRYDDGDIELSIRSASFPGEDAPGEQLQAQRMDPPRFPKSAAQAGVSGSVYLLLKVDRDGEVEEVAAEQTNLRYIDSENALSRWLEVLEDAAISAAKRWKFTIPATGQQAGDEYWIARVPVDYTFWRSETEYGQWKAYIPGPRQPVPWLDPSRFGADQGVDAAPGGSLSQPGRGLHLVTQLGSG